MPAFIDSHCHLCHRQFETDYDTVVARAREAGVAGLINVACDLPSAKRALSQAAETEGMSVTVGMHPHDAKQWTDDAARSVRALLDQPNVVAVGETGLDFFRNLSPPEVQRTAFEGQLQLAAETGLPAIIHDRDAHEEVLALLAEYAARGVRGVVHCFTGDWAVARKILDQGFHLGLTGLATYRSVPELTEVAKRVPLDRLLIETDCPYLTPQRFRKKWKRNEPALLPAVAEFVAEARNDSLGTVAEKTVQSTCELFGIVLPETPGHAAAEVEASPTARPRVSVGAVRQPTRLDERTKSLLELDKVAAALAERAATDLGLERCRKLEPSTDHTVVREWLAETSEARAVLETGRRVPFGGIRDLRERLGQARVGSVLAPADLLGVASTLGGLRGLHRALAEPHDPPSARLRRHAHEIVPLPELESEIDRCLDPEGEVRDSASDKLRSVRRRIASLDREAHRKVEALLSSSSVQKMLQEPLATVRNDRLCVPVRAEHRAHFRGLVHDQSASGATLFIEPAEVVDLGNRLRQAQFDEREEVHRILSELTQQVASHRDEIGRSLRAAGILDFIFARARLSVDWRCSLPELSDPPRCDLVQARHPLLGEGAVPIDVSVGAGYSVLLLTGPNTGGKTVALKTVGLLCLMAACGLHIPARHNSKVHLFSQVFVDIGDEQSIEQSLSTFSSHLKNIVEFTEAADDNTLVLLDEIGVGTDPDEGAALAKAILRRLKHRGARVIATTHYSELKNFAFAEKDVENACVEFNPDTLRPTYRVLTGVAGSSNAFVIAERLGLARELVEEACDSMEQQKEATAELIRSMEERRRELDQEATVAQREREEAERLRAKRQQELRAAREAGEETREEAMAAAGELLDQTRSQAEGILRTLRRQTREGKPTQEAMDALRELEQQLETDDGPEASVDLTRFRPGRRVRITPLRAEGVLLTEPSEQGKLSVRTDTATVETFAADLELLPDEEQHREPPFLTQLRLAKVHVPQELNLIGQTVEEAEADLDKYLDDASVAGLPSVRIIHGKGTGALRQGVHAFLKQHASVERFELAELNQGGEGATMAYLARV